MSTSRIKTTKVAFVLPKKLQGELKQKIMNDGYTKKGKSRWISEAIAEMLSVKSFPELVKINDTMKGFEKLESVIVSRDLKRMLTEAVIKVRKVYPEIEGVQSRIIRAAIVQRLLRY